MLTFELTEDKTIEVFFDEEGRERLAACLRRIHLPGDHEHLMTEAWGAGELSERAHSTTNKIIHLVMLGMTGGTIQPED